MFMVTAKLTRKKLVILVLCAFALLLAIIMAVSSFKSGAPASSADSGEAQVTALDVSFKGIRDNADRIALLEACGWETSADAVAIQEVVIPETFDDVYTQYNELQLSQGLDLTRYQGKTVRRYTYEITNYPTGETDVIANLLVYRNRVIAADICSTSAEGFMHGLEYPAS